MISKMMGNYLESTHKNTSNYGDSNLGSKDKDERSILKMKLMSRIDFANKNQAISDTSSPHLRSVYSRQAQLVSPGGYKKYYQQPSHSSNKSIGQISGGQHSDATKRFIAQGLSITHSKHDSANTEHELSIYTNVNKEDKLDGIKSPSNKFREIRKQIQHNNNQSNNYITPIVAKNILDNKIFGKYSILLQVSINF